MELEIKPSDVIPSEEDQKQIVEYLTNEIERVQKDVERKKLMDSVKKWRRQREARPEKEVQDFPWSNASNVVPPLAMSNTNGIYAKFRTSFKKRDPFWLFDAFDKEDKHKIRVLQNFANLLFESKNHLNGRKMMRSILYDGVSLGTQFVKIPWKTEQWNFKRAAEGGGFEEVSKIRIDSPRFDPIRYEDFLTRPFWNDLQTAPWIATRSRLFEHQLTSRGRQGIYDPEMVDKVLKFGTASLDENLLDELKRTGIDPDITDTGLFEIDEVFTYFDVDGDSEVEDIKIWFHQPTQTILRVEFNDLGIRDVQDLRYFERPNQLYGMGVGWMIEHMQDESEAIHNMRINGIMLSLLQMYITKVGSGIAPNERFRPLKNIQITGDPSKDFIPVKFPDIGPSSIQAEMMAKEYGDRATAASDYMMGFESDAVSSRTTMGGTMFLAQQNQSVLEGILEGFEEDLAHAGTILVYQLANHRERAMEIAERLLPEADLELLEEALNIEIEDIPTRIGFRVSTAEIEESDEARRKNMLTGVQVYTAYAQQMIPLLQAMYGEQSQQMAPQTKEAMAKIFVGSTNMMMDVLEGLGERDPERFLPYV